MPWYAPAFGQWPHWANAGSALEKSFRAMGWVETDGTIPTPGVPVDPAAARLVKAINGKLADTTGGITLTAGDVGAERVFAVAPPTGVAASDTARITAQANAAAAAGGGTVVLQPGVYRLNAALPVLSGVSYRGVPPVIASDDVDNTQYMPDAEFHFVDGTVLQGDGTFRCFEGNATDQGTVQADIGNTQISGAGLYGLGLEGFTDGIKIGAVNVMGLVFSNIDELYIRDCSGWGVFLANFQHLTVGKIRTCGCQHGQYLGALLPAATLLPGNSTFGELFTLLPRDGRDNRLCRGVVFEAGGTNEALNEVLVGRVQVNGFNRALLSVTATLTSASTSVTVPDGTQFAVGMPVAFTTTGFGYTASQLYIVLSVAGNTLTLGAQRTGAAISASGSGTLTLQTYGFPNVEITARNPGAKVQNTRLLHIDVEGVSTAGLYVENANACQFELSELPATALVHIAGRNTSYSEFRCVQAAITDFDGNSNTSAYFGTRGTTVQRPLRGFWRDNPLGVNVLAVGGGLAGQTGGDLHTRANGFLYPAAGMGEKVFSRDTAVSLNGAHCGDIVYAASAAVTFTLPTIDTASLAATHVGLWFEIYNCGTGTITVNTSGAQLLNKITGKTSTTVAPGSSLKLIAVQDAGGSLFWAAKASTLVA